MSDYIFSLYALLYNFNIHAILVDELHHPPLSSFTGDFPFIKEIMPPIIAFKHDLFIPLKSGLVKLQAEILNKYCDLYFVWGDLQKSLHSHLPQDKVISAGWNALDSLKNISTASSKKVFFALPAAHHRGCLADETQVIEELLAHTDLEIYIKAHPNPKKANYLTHERLHVMDDFDDYIPLLASCAFSLSFGSNTLVESLFFKKPHIFLPTTGASNPIFDPLRTLLAYNPEAGVVKARTLLAMVESQMTHWNQVDTYFSQLAANRFSSSEYMLRRIQAEIEKHTYRRPGAPELS